MEPPRISTSHANDTLALLQAEAPHLSHHIQSILEGRPIPSRNPNPSGIACYPVTIPLADAVAIRDVVGAAVSKYGPKKYYGTAGQRTFSRSGTGLLPGLSPERSP